MSEESPHADRQRYGLLLGGAALAIAVVFLPGVSELPAAARATAGVTVFTAWCWLTLALPLPISSLMPALLLPATGAVKAGEVARNYFPDILLLFLGGFILALALERYGLHRRFALASLHRFGVRPRRIVLGFMAVCVVLSQFISNTATALMMLPVAMAVLGDCSEEDRQRLAKPLLLGIAYSCSLGGLATPIGTAPNAVFLGQLEGRFPEAPTIGFGTWMIGALPLVIVFLFAAWLVLTRVAYRLPVEPVPGLSDIEARRKQLGPRTAAQTRVLFVFGLVALLWLTRRSADFGSWSLPGWESLLPESAAGTLTDSTVAMLGVLLLFALPGEPGSSKALLQWQDCSRLPWGVLLLLGGGFALAKACDSTGLAAAVGQSMQGMITDTTPWLLVALVVLVVTFMTEVTSNTATINVLLPLLFSASVAAGVHPMLLAIPTTFAVSCAFMLPVATPPNAILFSSGQLTIPQMARAGIFLNLLTTGIVTFFALYWIAPMWGFDLNVFPDWAR